MMDSTQPFGRNLLDFSSDSEQGQPSVPTGIMSQFTMGSGSSSLPSFQSSSLGIVTPQEPSVQLQHHHEHQQQQQQQQHQVSVFSQSTPHANPTLFAEQVIASMHLQEQHRRQQQLALLQEYSQQTNASHNLIPSHTQGIFPNIISNDHLSNLNGTPGYPSALIPQLQQLQNQNVSHHSSNPLPLLQQQQQHPGTNIAGESILNPFASSLPPTVHPVYTVQDNPMQIPIYNGVNPQYPGLRILNSHPPMFCVDNFLNDFECDFLIQHAQDSFGPAPVVGKGAGEVSPSRTSSTCYLAREDLPDILRKVSYLTGKPIEHCELPQVGRYLPSQQYLQHYDAFDMRTEDGRRFASNGGQRTITVLIYLNTVTQGGATRFPALNLDIQPVRGMALIFFPATVDGLLDQMALHAALPAIDVKYVSQVWIRQSVYTGQPSKRLTQTLGVPFGQEHLMQQQPQQLPLQPPQQHHPLNQFPSLGLYPQLQYQQQQQQQQNRSHEQGSIPLSQNAHANLVEPW